MEPDDVVFEDWEDSVPEDDVDYCMRFLATYVTPTIRKLRDDPDESEWDRRMKRMVYDD